MDTIQDTTRQPIRAASLWHVLPPASLAHLEIRARASSSFVRGARGKSCAVMKAERSTPCPMTGSGRKRSNENAT